MHSKAKHDNDVAQNTSSLAGTSVQRSILTLDHGKTREIH